MLPGSRVGNNVIIGAGTVVRGGVVPDNSVYIGNPGRVVCSYEEYVHKNMNRMKNALVFEELLSALEIFGKIRHKEMLGD